MCAGKRTRQFNFNQETNKERRFAVQKSKEKQSKSMTCLEVAASSSLLISKYLLAIGGIAGWAVAAIGYALTTIYNFRKDIKVMAVVTLGLLLLCLYGWYKWTVGIKGLQILDLVVIAGTVIGGLSLAYSEWKAKKPLWVQQVLITLLCMAAYIFLGLGKVAGWYCLAVAHSLLTYVYTKKGGYAFTVMQIISVYIALAKVIKYLPSPF